ncbi:MAG: ABC transporter permease [Candidatus Aeolococcus gillhamiae]|uniref:ABC transporter permease n=1 Tax=Candidatus Aeolococcus gillhamiae TaxID=3127015 RepID=A0A2W5YZ34_9BACT|nr:MAG: ABC transporter permease [Candidatus Dormibacter sp. RRmetagenome_bin12]
MKTLRSPLVIVGGALVTMLVVVAVAAPLLAPYDPRALSGASLVRPSAHHLLGTNDIGQDIFSQVVWGARSSLTVAVGSALLAVGLGVAVGILAGLAGGWVDAIAMRIVDVVLALPLLPLLVLIAALAGARRSNLVLIIGLTGWPATARIIRAQALTLRQRGFVDASRGFGAGFGHVARRHLLPALGPLIVTGFVSVAAHAVLVEAGLAFLGLADPTGVSWGLILNRALLHQGLYFTALWTWWVLPAGSAVTLAVLGFTFVGVGLEPAFNPRWRANR